MLPKILNDNYFTDFTDLFNDSFDYKPKTNVLKTEEGYNLNVGIPGLTKDDLKISVKEGILNISYKKEEKNDNHYFMESFNKSYHIPDDVNDEKIKAEVKNGILKLILPFDKKKITEKVIEIE